MINVKGDKRQETRKRKKNNEWKDQSQYHADSLDAHRGKDTR